jgi:hypothetical protein
MLFYCRLKEDRTWNHYFTKFIEFLELHDDVVRFFWGLVVASFIFSSCGIPNEDIKSRCFPNTR